MDKTTTGKRLSQNREFPRIIHPGSKKNDTTEPFIKADR